MANKYFISLVGIIVLMLSSCSTNTTEQANEPVQKNHYQSLLLPEHQDTTSIYKPLPDSVFNGISYNNPQVFRSDTFNRITFTHLSKVSLIEVPYEEYALMQVMETSDEVKSLQDQNIIIKGFLLPVIHTANVYVLSKHPYSNCFFCNKAGIESIMELHLINPPSETPKVDQIVIVSGKFKLYDKDPIHLPYTLKNAEIIGYL